MDFDDFDDGFFGVEALQNIARHRMRERNDLSEMLSGVHMIRESDTRATSSGTSLEKMLKLDDESSSYMRQGKFFEAYGMLKSQYKHGPRLHFAPVLVKYYVSLMQTDRADKADKIRDELIALLEEKFCDSPDEVRKYADHLRDQSKYFEAIMFYQVALHFAEISLGKTVEVTDMIQKCAAGLTICIIKLSEQEAGLHKLLKSHVIIWIQRAKDLLAKACIFDEKLSALIQSNILGNLGKCQMQIREIPDAITSFKESIGKLEENSKITAEDFSIYADHLGMLGGAYYISSRRDDAVKYLTKAVAAAKKGKDNGSWERVVTIKKYEEMLKRVRE